ncbi:30S ribosomal protein S3 [Candidatus Falkowbacteria bacterium CG10_big_fil_rev_8_21_14_0_10_39_11]|uniref:Small ribosomal subunit protein uS3 n=1 Tax=Candidatus Falkowbacteria bacterium CG10_big_fil_rev_8_21_14_0_10_39_11 TaxID=1974565 RepID=A0A2H0V3P0_9BACT|nr:MAG: 30S ribosomal protein S3 [Candidatus Falkowbacteria bacterium CG10_big_fil_rev_8_21_14_0_10_39_11]
MGKKINPKIFRIKNIVGWSSKWFSESKDFAAKLRQDVKIRDFLEKHLLEAFVSNIVIERSAKDVNVLIYSARPGIIIGKSGVGVEELRKTISRQFIKDKKIKVNITIKEVSKPNVNASLVAQAIKFDIEKRIPYRRAIKQAIQRVERAGAEGIKTIISGRLNGSEIARTEMLVSGKIPLHTIRANIDYAAKVANTTYGVIGVKVWIYKGEVFDKKTTKDENDTAKANQ